MLFKIIIAIVIAIIIFISYFIYNKYKNSKKSEHEKSSNSYYKDKLDSFSILNKNSFKDTHMKEFTVNEKIILIEDKCFINCKNLSNINVEEGNNNYCSKLGVLFTKDMKSIVCYPPLKQTSTYFIPQGVESINTHAFFNNNSIKYVIIPTSLKYIGENSFVNCKNLNQIVIPENVVNIHPRAFNICPRVIIRCYKNSFADDYCKKYYIPCEYLSN